MNTEETPKRDITNMRLSDLIELLLTYCLSFEQVRNMNIVEIGYFVDRIDNGELKTYAQKRQEQAVLRMKQLAKK